MRGMPTSCASSSTAGPAADGRAGQGETGGRAGGRRAGPCRHVPVVALGTFLQGFYVMSAYGCLNRTLRPSRGWTPRPLQLLHGRWA